MKMTEERCRRMAEACEYGLQIDAIVALVKQGFSLEKCIHRDGAPLHIVATRGWDEACEVLVRLGAPVDQGDQYGTLALMKAAAYDRPSTCRVLLRSGADVNATDRDGVSALMMAACMGRLDPFGVLLEAGADAHARARTGQRVLHYAAMSGRVDLGQTLLAQGVELDARDEHGATALHMAATVGHPAFCQLLIDAGATVRIHDDQGRTPLHSCASSGKKPVCEVLVNAGLDPNEPSVYGDRPISLTTGPLSHETALELVRLGADINGLDRNGENVLVRARHNQAKPRDREDYCLALIAAGADAAAALKSKPPRRLATLLRYPLYTAAGQGRIELSLALIEQGHDPLKGPRTGSDAFKAAKTGGFGDLVDAMRAARARQVAAAAAQDLVAGLSP